MNVMTIALNEYKVCVVRYLGVEGNWVSLQGGLHGLVSFKAVVLGIETVDAVATHAEGLVSETFAVQFETLRLLAVAAHLFL